MNIDTLIIGLLIVFGIWGIICATLKENGKVLAGCWIIGGIILFAVRGCKNEPTPYYNDIIFKPWIGEPQYPGHDPWETKNHPSSNNAQGEEGD